MPTRNEMLWEIIRSYRSGEHVADQLQIHAIVADFLEERGDVLEAGYLRQHCWQLRYDHSKREYFIDNRYMMLVEKRPGRLLLWWPVRGDHRPENCLGTMSRGPHPEDDSTLNWCDADEVERRKVVMAEEDEVEERFNET